MHLQAFKLVFHQCSDVWTTISLSSFLYLVILRVRLVHLVNWLNTALIENQENQQQLLNAHFENSL